MKKTLALLLAILMPILFVSCNNFSSINALLSDDNSPQDDTPVTVDNCTHTYVLTDTEATCLSGGLASYRCSLCDDTYQEYESALGHTTSEGTCSRCGEAFGTWEIAFYVDEFNNPTDEAYIRNPDVFYGTFSNSATTNSKLYALILIDAECICIKLWEYGSQLVKAFTSTDYDITILNENGEKYYTTGTMYKNGDRIYIAKSYRSNMIQLLQNNEELKIHLKEDSKYGVNSTYLFTIKSGNFNNIYNEYYTEYIN